jgi:hypothetical protein
MSIFRIFFEHGQAHDYEAASCDDYEPGHVILRDESGNNIVEYHDSDIAAVRDVTNEAA